VPPLSKPSNAASNVPEPSGFGLSFSDPAIDTVVGLPKRRQRLALQRARSLARFPATRSDYVIKDSRGRDQHHILADGFVFAYVIDHADRVVNVIEITDVRDAGV
jgi:hypothetical protein